MYDHALNTFNAAKQTLRGDVKDEACRKRALECIDEGLAVIDELDTTR